MTFVTDDHNILLKKLKTNGIIGMNFKWFENYLTNRKQYIQLFMKENRMTFVTDDHNILLKKLKTNGIIGMNFKWFENYLTNRKQYIQLFMKENRYTKPTLRL